MLKQSPLLLAPVLVLYACADASEPSSEDLSVRPSKAEIRPATLPRPPVGTVAKYTDAVGREWNVRQLATFAPDDQAEPNPGPVKIATPQKSDAELADNYRAVKMLVGPDGIAWEYEEVHPDVARFAAARARDQAGIRGYGGPNAKGLPEYVELPAEAAAALGTYAAPSVADFSYRMNARGRTERSGQQLEPSEPWSSPFSELRRTTVARSPVDIGSASGMTPFDIVGSMDERAFVTPAGFSTVHDHYATISITGQPWPTQRFASGTLIGRATAISAAHNFWGQTQSTWYSQRAWAVGVVRRGGTLAYNHVEYGPWNGCYWVSVPTAWTTGKQPQDDWAVIDFQNTGCSITWPGDAAAYDGFYINASNSQHVAANSWMYGYDQADPPPPNQSVTSPYLRPSLIARAHGAWSTSICSSGCWGSYGDILSTVMDMTAGGSGSALLQNVHPSVPTQPLLVGTMGVAMTPSANYARRLDNVMWSFTQAHSLEF